MTNDFKKVPCEVVQICFKRSLRHVQISPDRLTSINFNFIVKKQQKFQEILKINFSDYEIILIPSSIEFQILKQNTSNLGVFSILLARSGPTNRPNLVRRTDPIWPDDFRSSLNRPNLTSCLSIFVSFAFSIGQAYPRLFTPPNQNPPTMSIQRDNIFLHEYPLLSTMVALKVLKVAYESKSKGLNQMFIKYSGVQNLTTKYLLDR